MLLPEVRYPNGFWGRGMAGCTRVISEMDPKEISLVDIPANKHCRVIYEEINGVKIDIMTLRQLNDEPASTAKLK